jgi:hypothetical protein
MPIDTTLQTSVGKRPLRLCDVLFENITIQKGYL